MYMFNCEFSISVVYSLQIIDCLSHVSITNPCHKFKCFLIILHSFIADNMFDSHLDLGIIDSGEPENGASRLNGFNYFRTIIAAQHKSSRLTIITDNHSQSLLSSFGQWVCFIQYDYLLSIGRQIDFLLSKSLHTFSDDIYSSVIRSIQF